MKVEFLIQNEEVNLNNIIESEILNKCLKAYCFTSNIKESGFEMLEEHIIDAKLMLTMFIGINKKNTTKTLLENILEYTKDVYYYDNNNEIEFESNILIFENSKAANIYIISGDISEISLTKNRLIIAKIVFDLKDVSDKKEYKLKVNELLNVKNNDFKLLNKDVIQDLIDEKVIFSNKQYQHNVKSISEFLGKKDEVKTEEIKEELYIELPKVNLNKIEFDFDIDNEINEEVKEAKKINENSKKQKEILKDKLKEEVKKENEIKNENSEDKIEIFDMDIKEAINLDELLFTKSDIKLEIIEDKKNKDVKEVKKVKLEDEAEKIKSKKIDLNNITNYIYELSSKKLNEKDTDILKIPNYIKTLLSSFFEFDKTNKTVIDKIEYKSRNVNLEIIDAKNDKIYTDNNAKLMQKKSQTYFTFKSEIFKIIPFDDNDIARINKISDTDYKIEIISKDLQEYKLWSKMITMKFKNSDKKYGVM